MFRRQNTRYRYRNRGPHNPFPMTLELLVLFIAGTLLVLFLQWILARPAGAAEAATTQCPNPGEPCKIVTISPQEEQLLIKQGGILDTAQAGRYIDLGNIVAYFRMKLANAPAGEVKPKPEQPATGSTANPPANPTH